MPGPAVYVVVAVSVVATGYVFKEFVYDPHIAPKIRDWREKRKAGRNSQRSMHSPVHAAPTHSPHRSPARRSPPIELDTVVASEVDEWRTSTNLRHRQTHSLLDDGIPNELDHSLLSPNMPLVRSPPHVAALSSPASLSIPNLASFATDVDYTASSVDVTPLAQTSVLQSNLTSPQFSVTSPFSDVFELAQSRISEPDVVRASSGSEDGVFSAPSSVSSVTATDDEDDNDSLGSGESWHEIRHEFNRS